MLHLFVVVKGQATLLGFLVAFEASVVFALVYEMIARESG